jgi:hypothetical protein
MQRLKDIPDTPEGVLMRLKLRICESLGISPGALRTHVDRFVNNIFANTPGPRTNFAKVNINNELTKNRMTIKVFFKFLRILNVKRVKFSVTITTIRDVEVTVDETINLFTTDYAENEEA